jgi:two-component system sensor histidine kinase MprB
VTFRRRVTLLVAGAVALAGTTVAIAVYLAVEGQLEAQVEQELRRVAGVVRSASVTAGGLPVPPNPPPGDPPNVPRIIDAAGSVLEARAAGDTLPVTAAARAVAAGSHDSSFETLQHGSGSFAVVTLPLERDRAIQVSRSYTPVEELLGRLLGTSLIAGGSVILLAPLLGLAVAGGAMVPIRRLSRTAERIGRTVDLRQRAEVRGDDELASLAASFNTMLDRLGEVIDELARSQEAQRRLVADASHELRTPLTTLRANVELLALDAALDVDDRVSLVTDTLAQIDDLTGLMGQLIDLAREDQREPERSRVRLDEVIAHVVDRAGPRYPTITFSTDLEPTTVRGARDALARAVSNLVDNAAKWSPEGATVEVRLHGGRLEVRDHGPGIDETELPHVFQRFYRGARAHATSGSGLGLAIVERVVVAHGGTVRAGRAPGGGTVFTVTLPIEGS